MSGEPGPARAQKRRRGLERAQEIVEAARAVFSEKGYERSSVAEIAGRVGIVEGAIYKHFVGKRELLDEVMREFYVPLIARLRRELGGIRGARNRLRFVIWSQLQAFGENAGLCRVVIREIRPLESYERSVVRELNRELTAIALQVIEDAMRAGEFRSALPPSMIRDVIYGGIEHIAWKAVNGRASLDVERVADGLTDLILGGLAVRAAPAARQPDAERLAQQLDRLEALLRRGSRATEPGR